MDKKLIKIKTEDNLRTVLSILHNRLKNESRGMSRYKLSKLTGISESTISRFFQQESDISLSNFLKICVALEINPYLIPFELESDEIRSFDMKQNEYFNKTYLGKD